LAWKKHQLWHLRQSQPAQESEDGVTKAAQAAPVAQQKDAAMPKQPVALDRVTDPVLKARLERAQRVQERFLKAPEAFVASDTSDEFMEARRVYLPESLPDFDVATGHVTRKPRVHEYFCEKGEVDVYVDRGYSPVLNERGDHHVLPNGMAMMSCPQELFERREQRARAESRRMSHQSAKQMQGRPRSNQPVESTGLIEEENKQESMSVEELQNG